MAIVNLPKGQCARIQKAQNALVRIVMRVRNRRTHISPLLKRMHWLPVEYRSQIKTCLLVHKCLHGSAPKYLKDLLSLASSPRLKANNQLRAKSSCFSSSFSVAAPAIWNSLPRSVTKDSEMATFKKRLKTWFFGLAFPENDDDEADDIANFKRRI